MYILTSDTSLWRFLLCLSPELKLLEEVLLAETLQDTSIVDLPLSPILPQIALL